MRMRDIVLMAAMAFTAPLCVSAQSTPTAFPGETTAERDARMKWWREARFGMFIHWNVSSVPATAPDKICSVVALRLKDPPEATR